MTIPTQHDTVLPQQAASLRLFLHTAKKIADELNRQLVERAGIPLDQFHVLDTLTTHPGHRLRMSDLASAVGLPKSCLSHVVTRMENAG